MVSLLTCLVCVVVAVALFDTSPRLYLLLMPLGMGSFALSLLIAHFIGQPLRDLHRRIQAIVKGNWDVSMNQHTLLSEANALSQDFAHLCTQITVQQKELSVREKRQASFISDVAHELRTPLTAIRGNAEILLDPDLPPDMHDRFCRSIMNESERLSHLSNDLLTLQRIESDNVPLDLRRINIKKIAREVLDALMVHLSERQIHLELKGEAPDVLGNADRIKQVITNLVANASHVVSDGGHITVELYGLENEAVIAVKDDGPGFGDIDPKLLFERFYRGDSSRARSSGGSGLGLSIVKSIVEAHDGKVWALNQPSGGACFVVALPAIPPEHH